MNARDFSFTTLRDTLPRSSKTSMESQEDRKCSKTDIWSVRGKMRHRFEGWIRERCRKAEDHPVSDGLRQLSHLSGGESSCCGDDVG